MRLRKIGAGWYGRRRTNCCCTDIVTAPDDAIPVMHSEPILTGRGGVPLSNIGLDPITVSASLPRPLNRLTSRTRACHILDVVSPPRWLIRAIALAGKRQGGLKIPTTAECFP